MKHFLLLICATTLISIQLHAMENNNDHIMLMINTLVNPETQELDQNKYTTITSHLERLPATEKTFFQEKLKSVMLQSLKQQKNAMKNDLKQTTLTSAQEALILEQ